MNEPGFIIAFVQALKDFHVGLGYITIYEPIKTTDSTSFLIVNNISGLDGGTGLGLGPAIVYDRGENHYNPSGGNFLKAIRYWY